MAPSLEDHSNDGGTMSAARLKCRRHKNPSHSHENRNSELEREEKAWYAAYPAPETTPAGVSRETLLSWQGEEKKVAGRDFVLVDLRRVDFEGGTIKGAINLPAQSLYETIPALYALFSSAGIPRVIWFCGSSRGRGTRAAGWFADYIKSRGDEKMESCTLVEGIRGWATAGEEYVQLMSGYDAAVWA